MSENETTPVESADSAIEPTPQLRMPGWFKVSAIAAASALAGGLAAVWYYRKTLNALRHSDPNAHNTVFGISRTDAEDDV